MDNNNISDFRRKIAEEVARDSADLVGYANLENFPLHDKQCLYVFNWGKGGITFEIGLKNLLGYTKEELYLEDMMGLVHPEDRYFVEKITKEAVQHTYEIDARKVGARLFITYRFKKKNGSYIRLMRQTSSYEFGNTGNMLTNISILTDISFMGLNNMVSWELQSDGLDLGEFKEKIYGIYRQIFTVREKDIISLLSKGLTNSQIAATLFISKHTVATHRKKIFKKAFVSSVADLIFFCRKNGII